MTHRAKLSIVWNGLLWAQICALGGCVTSSAPAYQSLFYQERPYMLLPVDESMSCEGISDSFRFAAKRAARLENWLAFGSLPGFGYARFGIDAPAELADERARLDALSDLQRYKGCPIFEPRSAVAYERAKIRLPIHRERSPVVLHSRG